MRVKGKWSKGEMARTIVVYLLQLITTVIVWACALKTVAVLIAVISSPELGASVDLSDVLIFAAAAFGGELLLLLCKRVFAKNNDDSGGTY